MLPRRLATWPVFDDTEREGLKQVIESGVWGGYSPAVKVFESAFAEAHDCHYGISLANGTLSLEAALLACDVGPGDEVIADHVCRHRHSSSARGRGAGVQRYRRNFLQSRSASHRRGHHASHKSHYSRSFRRSSREHGRIAAYFARMRPHSHRRLRACARSRLERAKSWQLRLFRFFQLSAIQEHDGRRRRHPRYE